MSSVSGREDRVLGRCVSAGSLERPWQACIRTDWNVCLFRSVSHTEHITPVPLNLYSLPTFSKTVIFWFKWNYEFYMLIPGYWSEKYNSEHVVLGFADLLEGSDKLSCFCFSEAKHADISSGILSDPLWL